LEAFWAEKYNEVFKGKKIEFITERKNKKGQLSIKEVFLSPIFNDDGSVSEVSGMAHDITEKMIAEKELKNSLKEKEILLKEVHHRVKNNLQVISSILNLQSSYIHDEKILTILKESQNRIKSMAFIHESLYQTNDFSQINFSEYVVNLSKNLVHSYLVNNELIELRLDINKVSLNLDLSIPCGLIINELVSNALKYAFPENRKNEGYILISLKADKENIYLSIADNGVGLPKNLDFRNTESLGLQLVTTLVEQINGTITQENTTGTTYNIIFKHTQ
jgi:two-component sensor histidine kinase